MAIEKGPFFRHSATIARLIQAPEVGVQRRRNVRCGRFDALHVVDGLIGVAREIVRPGEIYFDVSVFLLVVRLGPREDSRALLTWTTDRNRINFPAQAFSGLHPRTGKTRS